MQRPTVWHVNMSTRFSWRTWDDDIIVYHHGSGDTHKLNPLSAQALRLLQQQQPMDARRLANELADSMQLSSDRELFRYSEKLLNHFDELGLIEPVE